jgi:hypothetical protein
MNLRTPAKDGNPALDIPMARPKLPLKEADLTNKERAFLDEMTPKIPDGEVLVQAGIPNLALRFEAPVNFSQDEFT